MIRDAARLGLGFQVVDQGFGRRLGVRADFGRVSKRMGLNWLKSRVERSCARKSSAASSVVRMGTVFGEGLGMVINFFSVPEKQEKSF